MKKLLLLVVTLLSTSFLSAQTMKELPGLRFHAMSENGKWMLSVEQGWIGILNTETDEFQEYGGGDVSYDLGLGNMVTNDGFLVGAIDGMPSVLDIDNKTWTPLGLKEGDLRGATIANCITPSRKYIVGGVSINGFTFGHTHMKPVIWTMQDDGTYGPYEELPYPETDFAGRAPLYILTKCISDDGTVIAAQMMSQDNECLPLIYRKGQDGTWTYEIYDKEVCEPGLEFPEYPTEEPVVPNMYDYMTEEQINTYKKDSTAYEDSLWRYNIGEITTMPTHWPDPKEYMTEEGEKLFNEAWEKYTVESEEFMQIIYKFREFYEKNINFRFYGQNAGWMSANGKYYTTTCEKDRSLGDVALFTIGETLTKHDYEDRLYAFHVTNDGDLFVSNTATAYVYPAGSTEKVTLQDWLRSKGETEAAEWLDNIETGVAICSADGRVISGYSGMAGAYNSWIIKLDETPTGITDIESDSNNGNVKVYDLQGRLVTEGKANEVRQGLKKGIYVIDGCKFAVK